MNLQHDCALNTPSLLIEVAVPVPLCQTFTYAVSAPGEHKIVLGARVTVWFANRILVGVVTKIDVQSDLSLERIQPVKEILDEEPLFSQQQLEELHWLANYYVAPIGEVVSLAIPAALRKGAAIPIASEVMLTLPPQLDLSTAIKTLKHSPKQTELLVQLSHQALPKSEARRKFSDAIIRSLQQKSFIETQQRKLPSAIANSSEWQSMSVASSVSLTSEQAIAKRLMIDSLNSFRAFLLDGVTGSGKTEVYLEVARAVLEQGRQVLMMVPEINLTPQMVDRCQQRLGIDIGTTHSRMTHPQRLQLWQKVRQNAIGMVLGTRSSIFLPFHDLGLIIIDEEHDDSYKQNDGVRYHARDFAIYMAYHRSIPVILGSATPSFETLLNAKKEKYQRIVLTKRTNPQQLPKIQLFDMHQQPTDSGLAIQLLEKIKQQLAQGNQCMIFLNRRGFATSLMCTACGYLEICDGCEQAFTVHRHQQRLKCHHCLLEQPIPTHCSACGAAAWVLGGIGTEQIEHTLNQLLPAYSTVRLDADTTSKKGALEHRLKAIRERQHQIIIGTQMVVKGHHFPHVSLVVVVNADGALYSPDFRSSERVAQLITQVAGRAGRGAVAGEVYIQTHYASHQLLQDLVNNGYQHFSYFALRERQHMALPPYTHQAIVRAESESLNKVERLLQDLVVYLQHLSDVQLVGPLPAHPAMIQKRHRQLISVMMASRPRLNHIMHQVRAFLAQHAMGQQVRWSLNIDPIDYN